MGGLEGANLPILGIVDGYTRATIKTGCTPTDGAVCVDCFSKVLILLPQLIDHVGDLPVRATVHRGAITEFVTKRNDINLSKEIITCYRRC